MILATNRRRIEVGKKTLIMGILNVTPDSFYDGGRYSSLDAAVSHALEMVAAGADIIDVGGESTRPGAQPVPLAEELSRVIPVIEKLAKRSSVPVSVDTYKAEVARLAIAAGAEIVNDISAMRFDPLMAETVAAAQAGLVIMHMRGAPRDMQQGNLFYEDLLGELKAFFRERLDYAHSFGIKDEQVIIDPGLGFGKTYEDNLRLIKNLSHFLPLERPILTGVSRKSFTRLTPGEPPSAREEGTTVAIIASILYGSNLVRVHDVPSTKRLVQLTDALRWSHS